MNLANLIDPSAAMIVVGGTLLATVLQCGWRDSASALVAIGSLANRKRFDAAAIRAGLATHVTAIRRDGILRVDPPRFGDAEIDQATAAMIDARSAAALVASHEAHRARRVAGNEQATRTLVHAAELAPIFGLAGTLLSLSQLAPAGIAAAVLPQAIGMAVLTTLYGLVLANLVFAPLARAVDRRGEAELRARQEVIDWLGDQLAGALPPDHGYARTPVEAAAAAPPVHRLRPSRGDSGARGHAA